MPPPGRVVRIEWLDAVAAMPGVAHAELAVRVGDRVRPLVDHTCRAGSVIATGESPEEAVARAQAAVAAVRFIPTPKGDDDAAISRHRVAG